jgi:pimeloyl-ACP methyl ester carboxylesterase
LATVLRIALSGAAVLALLLLVGFFTTPASLEHETVPPDLLADSDGRFITVNGVRVHYKTVGEGEPALILLHGFGAGEFTWQHVMEPLSDYGRVVAYDRPGFGLTERLLPGQWSGINPYSSGFQPDLLVGLMDSLAIERAILVGNSAGGNVAAQTALAYPERVAGLMLVDASIYGHGGAERLVEAGLSAPIIQNLGHLIARVAAIVGSEFADSAWYEPTNLAPELRAEYRSQLQVDNWDYGFWEAGRVGLPDDLSDRLHDLVMPILVVTGDSDRVVPTEASVRLARELPDAELAVMSRCGHVPNEECPDQFLAAVAAHLGRGHALHGPDDGALGNG